MSSTVDLDAYFQRIGYTGPREPTLEVLRAIALAHVQAIPFENLDPLLRVPVALDPAALESKLIRNLRGGYCFEQNLLLQHVLTALGFCVKGLLARVLWNVPKGAITARSHMVLLLNISGDDHTVDVGFGSTTPTAPLLLATGLPQQTPHDVYRYAESGGEWTLEVQIKEEWRPVYRFTLETQRQIDYEVANWYTSTHPRSHFLNSLTAARAGSGCRYTLLNAAFAVHHVDGRTERRNLASPDGIREVLRSTFGLQLPQTRDVDTILERILAGENVDTRLNPPQD